MTSVMLIMGNTDRLGQGYTPPKGRQTSVQGDIDEKSPRISSTVQWAIIGVALIGVLIVAIMFAPESATTHL